MTQIYRHDFVVPEESLDENGHVNNLEYLRWILDAAALHSAFQGATSAAKSAGATWVVRSHKIEYLRPAFAGEHISIWTWVSNFRRVQSLRKYRVVRLEDEAILAQGETNWVFVNFENGKIRSIPPDVQAAFEIVPEEQETEVLKNLSVKP